MSIEKVEEFGLEKTQVKSIEEAFLPKVEERQALEKVYKNILSKELSPETAKEARDARLIAVKIKSGFADIHKTQKQFSLAYGKLCDSWKNKETLPVQQMIDVLLEIEKHEERQKEKAKKELQENRVKEITPYLEDAEYRDFGTMDQDVWKSFFNQKKTEYLEKIAAEKKDEEERIAKEKAEAEEKKRIAAENEKLRLEAEKTAKIQAEKDKKAKEEKVKEEARHAAEIKKLEDKAKSEQAEKDKLIAEKKAEEEEKEKAFQAELNKGDAEKVQDLKNDLEVIKTKYTFKSAKNRKMYTDIYDLLTKVINHIK